VMKEGRIIATGHPQNLLEDEGLLESAGLEMPLVLQLSKKLNLDLRPNSMEEFFSMS